MEAINGVQVRLAPSYMTEPSQAIFRIYRDTRFSADKRPYKTRLGAWFGRAGIPRKSAAGFYFHLSSKDFLVAGGCYQPPPEQLRAIQQHLLAHNKRFRQSTATAPIPQLVGSEGESLSREPKGFPKDHPAGDLIRHQPWGWHASLPLALAQSPGLVPEISSCFETLAPVVELFNEPFLRPADSTRGIFFD